MFVGAFFTQNVSIKLYIFKIYLFIKNKKYVLKNVYNTRENAFFDDFIIVTKMQSVFRFFVVKRRLVKAVLFNAILTYYT